MKITSYEQAEEALNAIADFCHEKQDGYHLFAVMGDGVEESTSMCVGKYIDIIPTMCMTLISHSGMREAFESALLLSQDKDIVKSYWESNPQNIQN